MAQSTTARMVEAILIGVSIILISGIGGAVWTLFWSQAETSHNVQTLDEKAKKLDERVGELESLSEGMSDIQKDIALIQQDLRYQKEKSSETSKKIDRVLNIVEQRYREQER